MSPAARIAAHVLFEWTGIFVGARLYLRSGRTSLRALGGSPSFAVLLGCLLGAAVGNKAVHWFHRADQWPLLVQSPWLVLQGQTIVGGLLGGLVGVEIAKKHAGMQESTGDRFVVPILVGLMVGRVGCFVAGLEDDTYGIPTDLPWGVDLGDGVRRHPTQLYDIGFALGALSLLRRYRHQLSGEPGLQFKLMLAGYLLWRFFIDFLKPVPYAFPLGLSGIQVVCAVALALYVPLLVRQFSRLPS